MIEFESKDLAGLERDLRDLPGRVQRAVGPVVDRAAKNIKTDWVAGATISAGAHGKLYPRSIDYETRWAAGGYEAEIGPRTDRPQGGMGPGFEYGSVNQPPHLDGDKAALVESPRFELAIADLTRKML